LGGKDPTGGDCGKEGVAGEQTRNQLPRCLFESEKSSVCAGVRRNGAKLKMRKAVQKWIGGNGLYECAAVMCRRYRGGVMLGLTGRNWG